MRTIALDEATPLTSGGKAGTLASLRRAGIDVPDGFVVPVSEYRRHHDTDPLPRTPARPDPGLVREIDAQLRRLLGRAAEGYVAVRSSASDEDGHESSAAGQYETVLAVRGAEAVAAAVARCWASLRSARATTYRHCRPVDNPPPAMAVLVQRLVDADVSGVLFTGTPRVIEAIEGLGGPLVGGQVTPDAWTLDDSGIIARRAGSRTQRLDRRGQRLIATRPRAPRSICLTDDTVHELDRLGRAIATTLGYPADVEWALAQDRIHILQARPITAPVRLSADAVRPSADATNAADEAQGIPASPGHASGTVRVLRGPGDFPRVRPGDIIICRTTDPAWTPLFRVAAGIVTETGGLLSHAAIVARELRIPAILSVPYATTRYPDGTPITIDGTTGLIQH